MTDMCGAQYVRPSNVAVTCTFIARHAAEHSWRTLKLQDEQDAVSSGQYDVQVAAFLEAVAQGDLDRYLEALLAGCHEREAGHPAGLDPTGEAVMGTSIDALAIRRRLGRDAWQPPEEFGPDGWVFLNRGWRASLIVSCADHDGVEWVHASMAGTDWAPGYDEMVLMHRAVWGSTGYAYQVFAPLAEHVNIHPNALHLWGRLDGEPALPEFAGSIPGFERSI